MEPEDLKDVGFDSETDELVVWYREILTEVPDIVGIVREVAE